MSQLDRLLGPGVVHVSPTGSLRLNQAALNAQLHQPTPETGQRCWCKHCQFLRDQKPEQAAPTPRQPWEARAKLSEAAA